MRITVLISRFKILLGKFFSPTRHQTFHQYVRVSVSTLPVAFFANTTFNIVTKIVPEAIKKKLMRDLPITIIQFQYTNVIRYFF